MGQAKIKSYMFALPEPGDAALIGYWPLDGGAGNPVQNLKADGAEGKSAGEGFWIKGANMLPVITGTVKPIAFVLSVR